MFLKRTLLFVAALFALALPEAAPAQVVTQLPVYVNINSIYDFGNGPLEIRALQGNFALFTSQGSGTSTAVSNSTTMTLSASAAANPPCVGCAISGTGITAGTTVTAFNGTTGITLSAAMTVANGTVVSWGMACPTYTGASPNAPVYQVQAKVDGDLPLYTYARVCGYSNFNTGAVVLPFAIGAH